MSGSVAGLSSTGLIVSVNGTGVPVSSGATTVALASGLTSGTAYTVSVQTQPTGETCSVAGGMGTIASANVANVVVTCAAQAYALGGTISGLSSTGLVLANGTDTVSVNSGATSFTLPTQVAFGSSYNVTVSTQPAGQSCAVANGSSTMPAAAVTTVAVTCTSQPFTVGGTISGLGSNTGLVLTNGSDTLPVAANSTTFTMPTAVNFGSTYSVMAQSPAGLTCSVSNGSGPMGAANVTNVSVACSDLAYSLGGTISGLSATGLVLGNGTDTLTVPSGATTFAMPAQVAFGSAYNVMATSQPTGETCSVASGTGNMPVGGITGVSVTCSLVSYTIGGSIAGLTSTGLVLLDNGSDATPINANATTFTMNTSVASQSSYAVTVKNHPVAVNCSVASGSGPVAGAPITSVAVSCAPGTEAVVASLAGTTTDGNGLQTGMILGSDGNLYGATTLGGAHNYGAIIEYNPTTQTETLLYSFAGVPGDAAYPYGGLIQASDGNLYGTTQQGGVNLGGIIFKYNLSTHTETVLYSFGAASGDATTTTSGLIQGSDGNLYGVSDFGGANGDGALYEYNLTLNTESVLYSFGTNGGSADALPPAGSLLQASDGNFYGLTAVGGTSNSGALFKYNPTSTTESVLYSFTNGADGGLPQGGLIQGSDGNLYGMTNSGGTHSNGTIFEYNLATPAESVLYSFGTGSDGNSPQGTLLQASDGNFYGVTTSGGANGTGALFQYNPTTPAETVLYSFGASADGANPYGALIQTSNGDLYGTTFAGGTSSFGTIYVLN